MQTPSTFDAPQAPQASSTPDAVPTWRDLPSEPPYGPVLPPRTRNLGAAFAPVVVEQDASITPGQIAMAVGGLVLLVAIGVGAALLLLGNDDEAVAVSPDVTAQAEEDAADGLSPPPMTLPPTSAPSQGELEEMPPGGSAPDEDAAPSLPDDGPSLPEEGNGVDPLPADPVPPEPTPGDPPSASGQLPPPVQSDEDDAATLDLPRLFRLPTLPSGTTEDATTVRQTTRGDEVVAEQVTMLTIEDAEVGVRATRADDAPERLEALIGEDAEEISVRGQPGYLIDGQRLVWLVSGRTTETLIEIDAPPGVEIGALLTIAQGLELLR